MTRRPVVSRVRSAVRQFLLHGLVAAVFVATVLVLWIGRQAEVVALQSALDRTQRLADSVVAPMVTPELRRGDRDAKAQLDRALAPWAGQSVVRIKVWDQVGQIVYSDLERIIGHRYETEPWMADLLGGAAGSANFGDQSELENEFDQFLDQVVEVYVRSDTAAGPLVFEAYYESDVVRTERDRLVLTMVPPVALAMVALQLALLAPARRLERRIRSGEARQQALLHRAVEASDLERRRLARELHDEVIQDLAGAGYAVDGAALTLPAAQQSVLQQIGGLIQGSVDRLRRLSTQLYVPALPDGASLGEALERLADELRSTGIEVTVEAPGDVPVDGQGAVLLHRVAREAVVNVRKHADATHVRLCLDQTHEDVVLTVSDDGDGFDASQASPEGHLGLTILDDTMRDVGGSLHLTSVRGAGTTMVARLPISR